jgi:hypothetical protein
VRHLWEIDHPYYGADGHLNEFDSFAELRTAVNAMDKDMNLVYRWDWEDDSQPHRADLFFGDEERIGQFLKVFTLMPRKSTVAEYRCPIRHDQEYEVIEWLSGPRVAGHLRKLWEPILGAPGAEPPEPGADRPVHVVVELDAETVRAAVDDAVRRAVVEHQDRWYAQGWRDVMVGRGSG